MKHLPCFGATLKVAIGDFFQKKIEGGQKIALPVPMQRSHSAAETSLVKGIDSTAATERGEFSGVLNPG
jgi:hypothetical protein